MNFEDFGFNLDKLEKREKLLHTGEVIYPYSFERSHQINTIHHQVAALEHVGQPIEFDVRCAGRVWSQRKMGKVVFLDIQDETGKVQVYLKKDNFHDTTWNIIQLLDLGDIIGVYGSMFRTRQGETTIHAKEFHILSKTVVPIPIGKEKDEKVYNRLADVEAQFRERYLHWMLDSEDRERMIKRGQIISEIRNWMIAEGFLEVLTPNIELVYGGAEARPFKTNIWALGNREAFLRISPELYLKRYVVGGFPKVFTICQNFRNEGIDHSHNPEFTMMEWYEAYTDYEFQMRRFEDLLSTVCKRICGDTKVTYQGIEIDFNPPWKRLKMLDALQEFEGIDASCMDVSALKHEMTKRSIAFKDDITWGGLVAALFEATCEKKLIQPTFVIDHPVDISPMTKIKRGDNRLVERFEPFVYGMEIGNAYSELNDPVVQLERFLHQKEKQKNRVDQDYLDNPIDADFIKAIGCGMPPTGGVGFGIDRVVMLLTDSETIRRIIPFPMVNTKAR